jgi:hypothetical protein
MLFRFTAKLTEFVKELKADNKPFEVVYVSSDQSEKKMMDYMAPVRIFRRIFEDRPRTSN